MAHFPTLDAARRLLPWLYPEHRGYVLGQYGALRGTIGQEAADEYLKDYKKKEAENDASYEKQRALLRAAAVQTNSSPQELPDQVKLVWDPTITDPTQPSTDIAHDIATAEVQTDTTPIAGVTPEVK